MAIGEIKDISIFRPGVIKREKDADEQRRNRRNRQPREEPEETPDPGKGKWTSRYRTAMLKTLFKKMAPAADVPDRQRLALELAEIEEISEKMFRRIDERVAALSALEARLDEKAAAVEAIVSKASSIGAAQGEAVEARRRGVIALARKGLKADEIAEIFDMTKGEVELVLNLQRP